MAFLMRISLGKLLPSIIIGLVFLSTVITGIVSFIAAQNALSEEVEDKLSALTIARANMVQNYYQSIEQDLTTLLSSQGFQKIARDLTGGWDYFKGDTSGELRRMYVAENPNAAEEREKLDKAEGDFSKYTLAHGKHHPWLRDFVESPRVFRFLHFR